MGTLSVEAALSDFCLCSVGANSQRKEFAPWSKFFPLRVGLVYERFCRPGKQTGSHKSCSLFVKTAEKHEDVPMLQSSR